MPNVNEVNTNVFVKNLPHGTGDEQLQEMFSPFGEIVTAVVQKDTTQSKLLDYGYVNFKQPEDAQNAIKEMHQKDMGNNLLIVQFFISKHANHVQQTGPGQVSTQTQQLGQSQF
jgi:RNA recognition motif-containing protein